MSFETLIELLHVKRYPMGCRNGCETCDVVHKGILPPTATMRVRDAETYGTVQLSVQASSTHYCWPRVDGLPLAEYDTVEVALRHKGSLTHPRKLGIKGFSRMFAKGQFPVAANVPQARVQQLRRVLRRRAEREVK